MFVNLTIPLLRWHHSSQLLFQGGEKTVMQKQGGPQVLYPFTSCMSAVWCSHVLNCPQGSRSGYKMWMTLLAVTKLNQTILRIIIAMLCQYVFLLSFQHLLISFSFRIRSTLMSSFYFFLMWKRMHMLSLCSHEHSPKDRFSSVISSSFSGGKNRHNFSLICNSLI